MFERRVTTAELAREIGVSLSLVKQWVPSGKLVPCVAPQGSGDRALFNDANVARARALAEITRSFGDGDFRAQAEQAFAKATPGTKRSGSFRSWCCREPASIGSRGAASYVRGGGIPVNAEPREYLTAQQVSAMLQIDTSSVYRWAATDPTIPQLRLRARGATRETVRFPKARLMAWLRARELGRQEASARKS